MADGRKYEGWWFEGKQHGIGNYTHKDGVVKSGLCENGKRIKWLEEDDLIQIENKTFIMKMPQLCQKEGSIPKDA